MLVRVTFCFSICAALAWGQDAPYPEQQQRALRAVTEIAHSYVQRLPDFTCIRTTRHFLAKASAQDWHQQAKVAYELSYYEHQEHFRVVAVDDVPKTKVSMWTMASGWIETAGNFGQIVGELFDPQIHPKFEWHGWDYVHGRRAMVFAYHVTLAESQSSSGRCMSWIVFTNCKSLKYGYRGRLFVDADTFDLLRITHVPEDLPAAYSQGSTFVDFGRVLVAGEEYLLPVGDGFEDTSGKTLFRNESSYAGYRKFVADSTLRTSGVPLPGIEPSRAAMKAPAREGRPVEAGQCFEARDRAGHGKASAATRAAIAAAFDDRQQAEKDLLAVLRANPESDDTALAHAELAEVLARSGQFEAALEHAVRSGMPAAGLWEALGKYPSQSVAVRRYSQIPFAHREQGLAITVTLQGKALEFVIDTGAGISSIAESHTAGAGVTIHDDRFVIEDITGKSVECRLGIAENLTAGAFQLRNVPFCVVAGSEAPDILGLPVLQAFETIRWSNAGIFEIGIPAGVKNIARSNMCFENGGLVVAADLGQRHLAFNLDTGNDQTFLYPDFAEDFAGIAAGTNRKETYEMRGIGHAIELEGAALPELKLRFGGSATVLHNVLLLAAPLPSQCPGCYGNVGRDLLSQVHRVTLDFHAMKLTLEQ
ncbi:MAG TPA: aspartyl protease family protein [Bryobacteraceae bacterium]|nr:aspartyl protease family protein [Bryobacteraceae bacterium]